MASLSVSDIPPPAESAGVDDAHDAIGLLRSACSSRAIHKAMERLLTQPGEQRRLLVEAWVCEMRVNRAEPTFVQAVHSLMDDDVAERAFESIFQDVGRSRLARLRQPG